MSVSAPSGDFSTEQRRTFACGTLSGVFLIAAVVLSRRVSGDLSGLSSEWLSCGIGTIGLLVTGACLLASGLLNRTSAPHLRLLAVGGSLLPSLVLGLSLLPAGSSGGMTTLLTLYFCGVIAATVPGNPVRVAVRVLESRPVSHEDCEPSPAEMTEADATAEVMSDLQPTGVESALNLAAENELHSFVEHAVDDDLPVHPGDRPETTQWMSRSASDGYDAIEGAFRMGFAPGQRQVAIHQPFTPALASAPEIECEAIDGDAEVRIRVTSAEAYGMRIEVIRSGDLDQRQSVQLGYVASAAQAQSASAA